jgi:hypothetical protein
VWVVGVFGALAWLAAHRLAPGADEVVPARPVARQAPDRVPPMFDHPRGMCARTSLSQLPSLVAFAGRVATAAASLVAMLVVADGAGTSGQIVRHMAPGRVGDGPRLDRLARLLERAGRSAGPMPGRPGAAHGCPLRQGEP